MSGSASASTSTNAASSSSNPNHVSPSLPSEPSPEARRQVAEARAVLEASMSNIGSSLDTQLRSRAQNLHANSAQLDKQQKDLVKATEGLKKENDKLKKVAEEGAKRVKELGNVQNWAEMLERDFLVLEETLRLVNQSDSDSAGSWDTDESGSVTDDEERLRGIGIFGQRMGDWVDEGDGSSIGGESKVLDREGDTLMEDGFVDDEHHVSEGKVMDQTDEEQDIEHLGKGKGKENASYPATVEQQTEDTAGSTTATATTGSGSGSDPSSSSVHTAASAASGAS